MAGTSAFLLLSAKYIVFSLEANHWISFQIEVPPMPESKIPIGSLLSQNKLGSLVYISKYFFDKKPLNP
jgi:hypothetical protein